MTPADAADNGETVRATWPRDALPAHTSLHGYTITDVLGRGGFGITYRVVDRIDQIFALKECFPRQFAVREGHDVRPSDAQGQAVLQECLERFTLEARALTLFSRQASGGGSIIRVVTYFEANSTAYIVMEYVEGESLERVIKQHPQGVPEPMLQNILRPLLPALAQIHDCNLLHRDIKPANILIRPDGSPVLIDFGAARRTTPEAGAAFTQIYTESYAPIEQVEGTPQGPYSDIYALGMTLYHAIAGANARAPGQSTSAALRHFALLRHEADPLRSATEIGRSRYTPALLLGIDRALSVAPHDRPQTVREFMIALASNPSSDETVLDPMPAARTPTDAGAVASAAAPPVPTPSSRNRGLAIPLSAAAILAVAGSLIYGIGKYGASVLRPPKLPQTVSVAGAFHATQAELPTAAAAFARGDYTAAFSLYLQAATRGDANAQYEVGYLYQIGQGVAVNLDQAALWYTRAANHGNALAQQRLGYLYQTGKGVAQNYITAQQYYLRAATQGQRDAQSNLGYLYLRGLGVRRDTAEAEKWFRAAASQGAPGAAQQLGLMFEFGTGHQIDFAAAAKWYTQAAQEGYPASMYSIGLLYDTGKGVTANAQTAREWMRKAAAGGNLEARSWLQKH